MNDDLWVAGPILFAIVACFVGGFIAGYNSVEDRARNQGIIYCIEQPAKCKIEFQYLKLTEKTK